MELVQNCVECQILSSVTRELIVLTILRNHFERHSGYMILLKTEVVENVLRSAIFKKKMQF
jgi:hypothetical protein